MAENPEKQPLRLTIAGQNFGLRAAPDDVDRLREAADRAQQRIESLQKSGIGSTQRAAILAAFQLAYELDNIPQAAAPAPQNGPRQTDDFAPKLAQIIALLDEALGGDDKH
ncbi:cell division protein ZapA [Candidatus Sumerlaeota bacterium]|nr:cell division protein ZapA [Candidatus Sumerlaeota bacterium]